MMEHMEPTALTAIYECFTVAGPLRRYRQMWRQLIRIFFILYLTRYLKTTNALHY